VKILRAGDTEPTWVGLRCKCHACGCEFELEAIDKKPLVVPDPRDGDFYSMNCPNCGGPVAQAVPG